MTVCTTHVLIVLLGLCCAQKSLPSIYVYELPAHLSQDVVHGVYQEQWLVMESYDYEADLWVHAQITESKARTWDPAVAELFYIPVLPTRFLHMTLSSTVLWPEAVNKSGEYVREALSIVKQQPYWARRNGRDHFFAVTADAARCAHLVQLPRSVWGDISIVQHLGDLALRQHGWPCYDPDADILLPGYLPEDVAPFTPVLGKQRKINVLYRFGTSGPTAEHKYHDRLIRPALRKHFERKPVALSDWTLRNKNDTLQDMTEAIFCVCPPGIVAHTSRFWKAIRRGCIPVTFFKGYDLPFAGVIDYSAATVNIAPDNIATMSSVLIDLLNSPARLLALQQNLEQIQLKLIWNDHSQHSGIEHLFWNELTRRSREIYKN